MNTNDFEPLFTNEQLHKMSKENLAEVILLMQKQQVAMQKQQVAMQKQQDKLEEKVSGLQQKQKLLEEKNKELEFINALLSDRLSIAQRKRFGSSSEKYTDGYEQISLFNEAEEAADTDAAEPVMEEVCPKPYKRKKQKGKKEQDLSAYPVTETIHYTLEGENGVCPECGASMKEVTTEVTKTLKFIPAHFEVLEEAVHVYSCPKCSAMERASKPLPFLKGSIATPSLVTSILNGKYNNALPLERQSRAYKSNGINLATNTMANWVIKSTEDYLPLLYDRLHEFIYENTIIHADESPVKVMRIDNNKIKNGKKTYMWVYRNRPALSSKPVVLYDWQPSRRADHPREFLKDFSGTVTTNGYHFYHKLGKERKDLTIGGCWIHAPLQTFC